MIVGARPRFRQIIVEVWKPLTILFVWDVAVTAFHIMTPIKEPPLPTALFGTAIALFMGFRTNAAYARWWEARTLWGALINASRSLARITRSLTKGEPEGSEMRHNIILRQIAFAHSMRCQLRRQSPYEEIARVAGTDVADMAVGRLNPANALLEDISGIYADALAEGRTTEIQQATVERVLIDIANAQGGMERIKNTPLPNGFRFFPNLFTRVFCVLLPIALVESLGLATPIGSTLIGLVFLAVLSIGEDLTDPFANSVHDVPLTAMCRTIEIDLLQTAGLPAPEPLTPDHGVLWSAVRALRYLPCLTAARIGAVLFAGMVAGACNPAPSEPVEPAHETHLTPRLIAQRIMYCDDGSRADVDFIDDGLKMAVTWLPNGRTEILHAQRTGDEFRGDRSRAVVAGGSIAFTQGGKIRVCHRTPEGS